MELASRGKKSSGVSPSGFATAVAVAEVEVEVEAAAGGDDAAVSGFLPGAPYRMPPLEVCPPQQKKTRFRAAAKVVGKMARARTERVERLEMYRAQQALLPHHHCMSTAERKLFTSFEALDYVARENALWEKRVMDDDLNPSARRWSNLAVWFVFSATGILTGLAAVMVDKLVEVLIHARVMHAQHMVEQGETGLAYVHFAGLSVLFVLIAVVLVVYVEPAAAGSGIPDLKGYLNGTSLKDALGFKTLVVKLSGVILAVAGGLTIGKEGPLVHTGAIIAANTAHLPKLPRLLGNERLKRFRNDRDKRDFVSGGCACGVAAAFGAPIGGVLFSLEEASSFWNLPLTWRVFFCAIMATFTANLLLSATAESGAFFNEGTRLNHPGLITFGEFKDSSFQLWELPIFIALGAFGGCVGAFFNTINFALCHWRRDFFVFGSDADLGHGHGHGHSPGAHGHANAASEKHAPASSPERAVTLAADGDGGESKADKFKADAGPSVKPRTSLLTAETSGDRDVLEAAVAARVQRRKGLRVVEAVLTAFVTATIFFWLPHVIGRCKKTPAVDYTCLSHSWNETNKINYFQFTCKPGEYHDMATLAFTPQLRMIHAFFHDESHNMETTGHAEGRRLASNHSAGSGASADAADAPAAADDFTFSSSVLIVYFILYFLLAVFTYGLAVPSGLFVPGILCGCAFGRLLGEWVLYAHMHVWHGAGVVHPGVYALMGATAMLGGVARMTISLTIIVLETTGNIRMLLPVMIVLMVSKWTGDLFTISLYDMHLELKCLPFVEARPPMGFAVLLASCVMRRPVVTMSQLVSVREALRILHATTHNGFPVVDNDSNYTGLILRNQIIILLSKGAFATRATALKVDVAARSAANGGDGDGGFEGLGGVVLRQEDFAHTLHSTKLNMRMCTRQLARHLGMVENLAGTVDYHAALKPHLGAPGSDQELVLDLTPYLNPGATTVLEQTPLDRVYRTFRAMGMRHMVVTNEKNRVVGILTRKDMSTDFSVDLN